MIKNKYISVIGCTFIIVVLIGSVEILSLLSLQYYIIPRDGAIFYRLPSINKIDFDHYLQRRDPFLGWPSLAQNGAKVFDSSGARPSPAFPKPGSECIALYGNSFIYGEEVGDADAWGNVLSGMLGCRVANYGVGAYGTDQALLRFLSQPNDTSELVILGIFPFNIKRNVNQNRFFLTGSSPLLLKPRFIIENNALRLIDIPKLTFDEFKRSFEHPSEFYKHETFLVDTTEGPICYSFPYTVTLVKYLLSERVRNWLMGRPSWIGFLENSHRSNALEITTKIAERFWDEARKRNKKALVLFFPTPSSMKLYQNSGQSALQPLVIRLKTLGIDTLDLHKPLIQKLGEHGYCSILTNSRACNGHFNVEGNRLVAEIVLSRVDKM